MLLLLSFFAVSEMAPVQSSLLNKGAVGAFCGFLVFFVRMKSSKHSVHLGGHEQ